MGNNKHNGITLITVTVISLFAGSIIMAPPQLEGGGVNGDEDEQGEGEEGGGAEPAE